MPDLESFTDFIFLDLIFSFWFSDFIFFQFSIFYFSFFFLFDFFYFYFFNFHFFGIFFFCIGLMLLAASCVYMLVLSAFDDDWKLMEMFVLIWFEVFHTSRNIFSFYPLGRWLMAIACIVPFPFSYQVITVWFTTFDFLPVGSFTTMRTFTQITQLLIISWRHIVKFSSLGRKYSERLSPTRHSNVSIKMT